MSLRCLRVGLLIVASMTAARAQPADGTVTVGWSEILPLFRADENGGPGGFGAEVIREVATKAGFEVTFRKFDTAEQMIRAQAGGEIDILPAIAALPLLEQESVFSAAVAETSIRVFVRAEDAERMEPATMSGLRIAVPSVPLGLEGDALRIRNMPVEVPVGTPSITELLRGTIDALVASDSVTVADAREMRLDHRIVAIGAPLRTFDRIIAINRARRDLLEPINAAIAELEADGTLPRLREITEIAVPLPAPEVLTIGVYNFPPYNIVEADGTFTGFSVETTRVLAEDAGLSFRFVEISQEEWGRGPGPGRYDLLTQAGISDERRRRMDFTVPVERSSFEIMTRAGEGDSISDLASLRGQRVGVDEYNLARKLAQAHGGLDIRVFAGKTALLRALLDGHVDAILFPKKAILSEAARTGEMDLVHVVEPPFHIVDRAIALRFGLGQVRERLNAVIPGYLGSPEYVELRQKFLEPPNYWSAQRTRWLVIGIVAVILLLLMGLIGYLLWQRREAVRVRRRVAAELMDHVPIAMLLISSDGQIEFANAEARNKTPGGREVLREGAKYSQAVASLVEQGAFDAGGAPTDLVREMTTKALEDGASQEYRFADGGVFIRTAKLLANGSTLLTRVDVTEGRRQLQAIQELNAQLEAQIAVARVTNEELRAFAYATSHDLKAPTNTSQLLIEALLASMDGKLAEEEVELFNDLVNTNRRMADLIDDVLDYTNAIGSVGQHETVNLNECLADVVENLRADIRESGAQIRHDPLPSLTAHPSQMRQLLQNLLSNAIKFRSPDRPPRIDIGFVPCEAGQAGFRITDNGIGIAPEHQDRIFRLFSRLNSQDHYDGTGLGLAICQRIALNHGGRIEVSSTDGEGSSFTVILKEVSHDPESAADRRQRGGSEALSPDHRTIGTG